MYRELVEDGSSEMAKKGVLQVELAPRYCRTLAVKVRLCWVSESYCQRKRVGIVRGWQHMSVSA